MINYAHSTSGWVGFRIILLWWWCLAMMMMASVSASSSSSSSPVIGILTQPIVNSSHTMIAASYVKWLEAGGARSIPIPYDASPTMVKELFTQVNGILFPGGASELPNSAREIWKLVVLQQQQEEKEKIEEPSSSSLLVVPSSSSSSSKKNHHDNDDEIDDPSSSSSSSSSLQKDFFPIWGTCLGFEYLIQLAYENDDENNDRTTMTRTTTNINGNDTPQLPILDDDYLAENISLPLYNVKQYQIFAQNQNNLYHNVQIYNITMNNHHKGIPPQRFYTTKALTKYWKISSINYDINGKSFVSTIEPISPTMFPIYGVQYHPEKNAFEYGTYPHSTIPYEAIDHSPEGISMSLYMSQFFVNLAIKNQQNQQLKTPNHEKEDLFTLRGGAGARRTGTTKSHQHSQHYHHEYTMVDKYPLVYSYPMKNAVKFEQVYIIPPARSWDDDGPKAVSKT